MMRHACATGRRRARSRRWASYAARHAGFGFIATPQAAARRARAARAVHYQTGLGCLDRRFKTIGSLFALRREGRDANDSELGQWERVQAVSGRSDALTRRAALGHQGYGGTLEGEGG